MLRDGQVSVLRDEASRSCRGFSARHGQPTGERDARPSSCAAISRTPESNASSTRRSRSGPTSSRGSQAAARGPTLLLISHTDTVRADPEEWSVDPWSGELRDGEIWGRGALDMKSQVAASAVAIATLAARASSPPATSSSPPPPTRRWARTSASWLCGKHPDAVRADYCVNEGGGDRVMINGRPVYLCSTAEKMSSPFVLRVTAGAGTRRCRESRTTRSWRARLHRAARRVQAETRRSRRPRRSSSSAGARPTIPRA